uniref:Transposase n=1 Tax=Heterorhabditis bacteriophora TaxID=37862 RepID=A0A1I7WE68_HETBA
MSRGKNIPSNQRVMIEVLLDQNLGQVQIAKKQEYYRTTFYHMLEVEGWNEIEYSNRTAIQNTQVTARECLKYMAAPKMG